MSAFEIVLVIVISIFFLIIVGLVSYLIYVNKQSNKKNDDYYKYLSDIDLKIDQTKKSILEIMQISNTQNNDQIGSNIRFLKDDISSRLNEINVNLSLEKDKTASYLLSIKESLTSSLKDLQEDNSRHMDKMQQIVDEKLQQTLNERLTSSFKEVQNGLNSVIGVVEKMNDVSNQVDSLSRVLTNVKTKGILGEGQLGNILEDFLSPYQYDRNVCTKKGSKDVVEFAIKLPGQKEEEIYLPIDAKFPLEKYKSLLDAYDSKDSELIKAAKKDLSDQIKSEAKDIYTKYIDVPNTTDFGILFLPTESLYAEVLNLDSVYQIQREYHVMIAGPTNMAALLNSLSYGFKTLALQKNTKKIGEVLIEVKKEFENYQTCVLDAQKKINAASNAMDEIVGKRTRAIMKKLSKVEGIEEIEDKDDTKDAVNAESDKEEK